MRFRQARHAAFDNFAYFLPRFVAAARQAGEPVDPPDGPVLAPPNDGVLAPEVQQQVASTGYIDNGEHFITLLSQAEKITIVGFTNESLAPMLRTALARKRAALLRQDSCWSSVRVVFLSDELLDRVSDERGYPDPVEARLTAPQAGRLRAPNGPGLPARPSQPGQLDDLRHAVLSAADRHAVRDARRAAHRAAAHQATAAEPVRPSLPAARRHPGLLLLRGVRRDRRQQRRRQQGGPGGGRRSASGSASPAPGTGGACSSTGRAPRAGWPWSS